MSQPDHAVHGFLEKLLSATPWSQGVTIAGRFTMQPQRGFVSGTGIRLVPDLDQAKPSTGKSGAGSLFKQSESLIL